uniref:Uncharacterized protein n=1 Tax=Arundo donax TaxID=35708 RepID=A0A0A8Y5B3_ARUDO
MSAALPKTTLETIDRKRWAFFWTGADACKGSDCKVPWEEVCQPKEKGGLGIVDIKLKNECLTQKFLHRLHESASTRGSFGFRNDMAGFQTGTWGMSSSSTPLPGRHWLNFFHPTAIPPLL